MMDSSEYLKYMTERVVHYLDKPAVKKDAERSKPLSREPWLTRWFGVLPMGVMMWWGQKKDKRNKNRANDKTDPYSA